MRIDRVKIGAHRFAVTSSERPTDDPAEIDYEAGTIDATTKRPPSARVELLMHEVVHGLLDDSGIVLADELDEQIVRAITPRLVAFMQDNPDAVREMLRLLEA